MAWGRKKGSGRKEPQFGLAASLSELRLGPKDRVARDDDEEKPKKSSSKRRTAEPDDDDDDDAPRERKPRPVKVSRKRKSKSRARVSLASLFYWGAVLGLWAAIALVGLVV